MPSIPYRIPANSLMEKKDFLSGRMINVIDKRGAQFYGRFVSIDPEKLVIVDARNYSHKFLLAELSEVVAEDRVPVT